MLEIQDHLSDFPPPHGERIKFTLCWTCFFLTEKPLKTDMLFTEMSQLWTHSGLVAKRPKALQCPAPVQSHLLERVDYNKSDSAKTRKTVFK